MIFGFIDFLPDLIIFKHHVCNLPAGFQGRIRIDRRRYMDSIFLYIETVLAHDIGILHCDKAGQNRGFIFGGKGEGTGFEGLWLAVIPPHTLFGIKQHEIAALNQLIGCADEFLHGFAVRGQRERIAVAHEEAIKTGEGGIIAFTDDTPESAFLMTGSFIG